MTPVAPYRIATLESFRELARRELAAQPETRSLLFALAQFWNDQADDEMHELVIASPRDVPAWPHYCEMYGDTPGLVTPGDRCAGCSDVDGIAVSPDVFARFCHEYGSQDRDDGENFTPFAIARRRGEGAAADFEIEVIGKLWRPDEDLLPAEPEAAPRWLELPRARDLYDLVCASPGDDGPRRVLADYLLEHEHPRGELIALALAEQLPAEAIARRAELLEAYGRSWLGPLGPVIPESGARWERGFLARADVYLRSAPPGELREAPVWGTVEQIRFLHRDFLDPAMAALRDVGPVREGLHALPAARRPWAIERLHAAPDDREGAAALWRATTLPRLAHLVLEGAQVAAALEQPRPPWWGQLARLTLILDCDAPATELEAWRRRYAGSAPWVAIAQRSSITCDLGWEVATGPGGQIELALAGWHEAATPLALAQIAGALPPEPEVWLAPSRHWAPLPEDAERLAELAGRPLRIAPR